MAKAHGQKRGSMLQRSVTGYCNKGPGPAVVSVLYGSCKRMSDQLGGALELQGEQRASTLGLRRADLRVMQIGHRLDDREAKTMTLAVRGEFGEGLEYCFRDLLR